MWAAIGLSSAWAVPPPPSPPSEIVPNPRSIDQGSEHEGAKLQKVKAIARSGDASAAFRLSRHYAAIEEVLTLAEARAWIEESSRLDGYRDPGIAPALEAKYAKLCETRRD